MSDGLLVYRYASDLLQCATDEVAKTDAGVSASMRRLVVTGPATAWDDCCNGQLTVNIQESFPSANFPMPDTQNAAPCGPAGWATTLSVTVLRCAPAISQSGKPPTPERVDASTREVVADASAIRRAITCCFAPAAADLDVTLGAQTFVGPEGGCVGSTTEVTIGYVGG